MRKRVADKFVEFVNDRWNSKNKLTKEREGLSGKETEPRRLLGERAR